MENKKNIGIWMDHSNANLIDIQTGKSDYTIVSEFDFEMKEEALQRSENIMHNKRQQMNDAFYKEIGDEISKYDNVLLFGPTNAKSELHNYLNKDSKFKDIQIEVQSADKMTDNEKVAFVKNHFKK